MTRRALSLFALLALAAPLPAQEPGRPDDGLLERADLQAIVDLQVERDGAALVARLDDPDPVVRARAAFGLASVQDPAAVPALLEALDDGDPRVRSDAAFAIGRSAGPAVSAPLLETLAREPDPVVRARLLEALGEVGDDASLARLAAIDLADQLLDDLALAIARYGTRDVHHPAAVARLATLLDHQDPRVRESAAYYFGRTRDPSARAAAEEIRTALDRAYAFQFGGPDTIAPPGPAPDLHLVSGLGGLGDPEDTDRLVRWLEDAVDWRVRVNAARELGERTELEAAREALVRAFADPSPHVVVAAAAALAAADSLPDETVHEVATWTVPGRREWRVTAEALPVLARAGADGFVIFYLMWLDVNDPENGWARAKALRALGWGDTRGGFLVLEDQAGWEDPRVASAAVEGLVRRWRRGGEAVTGIATPPRYYGAFVRAMLGGDVAAVAAAAPALADSAFGPLGGIGLLIDTYRTMAAPEDLEGMEAILRALGESGDPTARPLLEEALSGPHPLLPRVAAGALEALTGEVVEPPEGPSLPGRTVDWDALGRLGPSPGLVLETEKGRIEIALDVSEAPLTVQTVAALAEEERYDGVPFHRVVPNFVAQGGDVARGDGWGGPGFSIRSELGRIPFERGTIGMAHAGKDTEGSQWFLTHSMQPHLDGRYTAFGVVIEGMETLDRLLQGDRLLEARVVASEDRRASGERR
ncbi:MAG: HEAT repeat domain-containing protein [Gemmatimonadetes bacterium]|nr:HEAT repeat domain-containing protein [Gemmatimonadota bacterium]